MAERRRGKGEPPPRPRETVAVLLIMETDDHRLTEHYRQTMTTAGDVADMRRAVLQHLPKAVQRVVAVMPEATARLMCEAHDQASTAIGMPPIRPPADYIPPTRD